jgi:peptidyl-prolyl cis-trans isomerase SurA
MASQRTSDLRRLALTALLGAAGPALAQTSFVPPGERLDGIVAVVNEDVILQSELALEIATISQQIAERGGAMPPAKQLERQVLERMLLRRLQVQLAERAGIQVSDDELDQTLRDIAKRNGISLEQLVAAVAARGMPYPAYRENLRQQLLLERVQRQEVERRAIVTPAEVDQLLATDAEADDAEYEVSHILIALRGQASPEEVQKNQERARATYEFIVDKGNDFATVAASYSDAPDALEGGSLGWRKRNQLPSVFADVVAKMSVGEVSKPLRSQSGFHIIKLVAKRASDPVVVTQYRSRHILIRPDQVRTDEKAAELAGELRAKIVAGADFGELAKQHSDDPGSKNAGGELDWSEAAAFAQEFGRQLTVLPVGEVSEPFPTQFGWHILEVLEKREQDVTEQAKRNRIAAQLRQRKVDEQGQLWLQRLRDEAYLEIRLGS